MTFKSPKLGAISGIYEWRYPFTYQLDELRQPEPELDQHGVGVIADRPDQTVVVTEQVVVQPFGVRVAQTTGRGGQQDQQR